MIALRHQICKMKDQPFFGYSLATSLRFFDEGLNSVHLSEQLANVIKISEEHWKTAKQLFQNVKGHMESVN